MRKNQLSLIPFALTLAASLLASSCTKEKRNVIAGSGTATASGPATLSTIQADIFELGCAVSGCHDNRSNPSGNLSLTNASQSYSQLVGRASSQVAEPLVTPGDAEKSYFIDKLRGTHLVAGGQGVRMPQYAAPLVDGQLQRIIDWVQNGAQQN